MLTSLVNKKDSTTYSTYSYNYNLDGNINRKVESGKATDYVYDGTGRLSNEKITNGSAVTNMTYAYDNAGNRSSLIMALISLQLLKMRQVIKQLMNITLTV